jgi:uncharacterized protein
MLQRMDLTPDALGVTDPPFAVGVPAGKARRQICLLLGVFYAVIYGGGLLIGGHHRRLASAIPSTLVLAGFMLFLTALLARRDPSWRMSFGLTRLRLGRAIGWSLFGFLGTYALNIAVSTLYLSAHGDLESIAARRITQFGSLAELPLGVIAPLVLFVAVWEETVFRGFLLGRMRAAMPRRSTRGAALCRDAVAVLLTAVCFGAGHGYQGPLGLVQTATAGVALGILAVWRQSLWPAIGAHLLIDGFGLLALKALQHILPTA